MNQKKVNKQRFSKQDLFKACVVLGALVLIIYIVTERIQSGRNVTLKSGIVKFFNKKVVNPSVEHSAGDEKSNTVTERSHGQHCSGNTCSTEKRYICIEFKGRLGNVMFEYASTYGIGRLKNLTMLISENDRVHNVFKNLNAVVKKNNKKCYSFPVLIEDVSCAFNDKFMNIPDRRSLRIGNYLQSWKYFGHVVSDIREQFVFNDSIRQKSEAIFRNLTYRVSNGSTTFVGVHVRRGDMFLELHLNAGYNTPPLSFYTKSMEYMKKLFHNVFFIVASDDTKWIEENLLQSNVAIIKGNNPAEVDMAVLTMCNHSITSVGSFSWWAGFLTGGLTVYYRYPAREASNRRRSFSDDMLDFFHPEWVGMD